MEELVTLSITQLEELMKKKLIAAGLPQEAASETFSYCRCNRCPFPRCCTHGLLCRTDR